MASDSSSKPPKKTMVSSSSPSPSPSPSPSASEKSKSRISKITTIIKYKECRRNHAVSMGGYALDGCHEFISGTGGGGKKKADDDLHCDACGCHRNFHRKEMIQNGVPLGSNGDQEEHPAAVLPSASTCLLLMGPGPGPYQYLVQPPPPPPPQAGLSQYYWNNGCEHRVFNGDDEELNNNGGMVDDDHHQVAGKKTNPKKKPKLEN